MYNTPIFRIIDHSFPLTRIHDRINYVAHFVFVLSRDIVSSAYLIAILVSLSFCSARVMYNKIRTRIPIDELKT